VLREDSDSPGTAGAALPSFGDVEQHHRSSREIEAERERFGRVLPHQEYLRSLATLGHCLDGRFQIIERDTGEAIGIPTFFGLLDHPSEIQFDIEGYDRQPHGRWDRQDLRGWPSLRDQLKQHYRICLR